jgi:hypothetical protein
MRTFLFLAPPLLGALLGSTSVFIGLRLLFWPTREIRIFARRLPLTPGWFLRERGRIARMSGKLLASELLSGELLADRLADPDLRAALEKELGGRIDVLLSLESGKIVSGALGPGEIVFPRLAQEALGHLVASEAFSQALALALGRALTLVDNLPLSILVPPRSAADAARLIFSPDNIERFKRITADSIDEAYGLVSRSPDTGIGGALMVVSGKQPPGRSYIGGILPPESLEPLIGLLIDGLYRSAIPVVENFLNMGEMRKLLESSAKEIVRRAISRLNVVQRLIVGAANYEKTIAETMPETVEDLVDTVSNLLRSPLMAAKAREAVLDAWRDSFEPDLHASLGLKINTFISHEAALTAAAATLDILARHGPELALRAASLIADRPDTTLGSFFSFLGISGGELAKRGAVDLASLLGSEGGTGRAGGTALAESMKALVATLLESLGAEPLGSILGTDEAWKRDMSAWLADRSLALVASESGRIIDGLEIDKAVVAKIEALDMLEAKRIFGEAAKHEGRILLAIGAAIGAAIGLSEAIVMLFFY